MRELAVHAKNDVSWLGIGLVNERYWSILPLGPKLYDGISGIILFLAYLSSITGEKEYEQLARRGLVTLRRQLNDSPINASIE